jgi:hypothetical protein
MKFDFVKSMTANKLTLAPGFRFVKKTDTKYTVYRLTKPVATVTCKCGGIRGSCSLTVSSGGVGSCKNSGCRKGCAFVIEGA